MPVTQVQVDKMAKKVGKVLCRTTKEERADNVGCFWVVRSGGWSGGKFFSFLQEAYDYVAITCRGQEVE